ncbi:MAG: RcpC/CpaB family pilus assembly protein [Actinomycetota bacterium]|nr:RcpC/CpaB family pilus assembly protein [Actinomycetota bacterium]
MDVPQAVQLARPAWVNPRTVMGLLLLASSFLLGHQLLRAAEHTSPVWVATRDLATDDTIGPDDLRVAHVRMPSSLLAAYASPGRSLVGASVSTPVRSGELLSLDRVVPPSADGATRTLTIPVTADHAVGGDLRAGDRVDVVATFDATGPGARTVVLVRAVEVRALITTTSFALEEGTTVGVSVAVSPDDALRLAHAIRTAQIDILRVDGMSAGGSAASVDADDFR